MLLYQHQPDEAISWRKTPGDDDSDWWAGVQKVGATVALATALVLTGAQTAQAIQVAHLPQDEVVSQPVAPIQDEDFWNTRILQAAPSNYVARPFTDTDEIVPQPVAPIQDEDYWQSFAPQPAKLWQALPYNFDAAEFVSTFDEDYWQASVAVHPQTVWPQQFLFDTQEVVPQPIIFQPDEDCWQPLPSGRAYLANFIMQPFDCGERTFTAPSSQTFVIWIQEDDS